MSHTGTEVSQSTLPGAGAFMGPVRRVSAGDIEIGYRQFGQGQDLVVITGDLCTMSLWGTEFPAKLSAHFRVTLLDNRGAGYSTDNVSVPMTIELLAEDTARVIGALRLDRLDLLGWSMGGEIALTLAVRHRDVVRRLVTTGADTGGRNAVPPSPEVQDAFGRSNPSPESLLDLLFPPHAVTARRGFIEQYRAIPQEAVPSNTIRRQADAETRFMTSEVTWQGLKDVPTRMLITNGGADVVNPPANADVIVQRVGAHRADKVIFDGAGHAMWFQEMDRFVALVADFLQADRS